MDESYTTNKPIIYETRNSPTKPLYSIFIISTCITLCLPITTTLHSPSSTANDRNLRKDAFNSKFQNYFAKKRNNKKLLTKSQSDHIIDVCAKRDELDKSSFLEYVKHLLIEDNGLCYRAKCEHIKKPMMLIFAPNQG